MAEIKSTLDLVLERTKNLSMTEAEKEAFHRREREEQLRGVILKFLNGLQDMKSLKKDVERIGKGHEKEVRTFLKERALEQIDPAGDNSRVYQLLEKILGMKKDPYAAASKDYMAKMESEQSEFLRRARLRLEERGISGSAVSPDLSRDEEWNLFRSQALADFRNRIRNFPDN